MASDWLRALKKKCPGVPVVAFSQLEATVGSLEELVAGAIAKRLDTKPGSSMARSSPRRCGS